MGGTAEFVCKYFCKGQLVAVQGSIQTRSYTDAKGVNRKTFEILASQVYFAEPKRDAGAAVPPAPVQIQSPAYSGGEAEDFEMLSDEDLPF